MFGMNLLGSLRCELEDSLERLRSGRGIVRFCRGLGIRDFVLKN